MRIASATSLPTGPSERTGWFLRARCTQSTPRRSKLVAAVLTVGLSVGLAACGPGEDPAAPQGSPAASETPAGGASADPGTAPKPGGSGSDSASEPFVPVTQVTLTPSGELAGELTGFTGVSALGEQQFLLAARGTGQLVWVAADGTRSEVVGPGAQEIKDEIAGAEEIIAAEDPAPNVAPVPGLFGVTLAPNFTQDPRVFFFVSTGLTSRVVSATWTDGTLSELTEVIGNLPAGAGRNGGALSFAPDGYLFISVGDAGLAAQVQAPTALAGKILRVATDGTFPPNNPLTKSPVWSLGHGNVTGLAVTGQGVVYAIEQGSSVADELNLIVPGHNYGWPLVEGMGTEDQVRAGFTSPQLTWDWTRDPNTHALMTAGDPVAIVAAPEGLYVAGANGQNLWWISLAEQGLASAHQELTEPLGAIVGIAGTADSQLAVLTGNSTPSVGTATSPRTVFPPALNEPDPDLPEPAEPDATTEPDPDSTPEPELDRLLLFSAHF